MSARSNFHNWMIISRTVIISIGLIGNIISFIVFSRNAFRYNSISTYCRALAIFDCLIVIELINDVYRLTILSINFPELNDLSCKLFYYLSMEYTAIPAWILVAFSVDKILNMRTSSPQILKSKLFQWSLVAAIVLFNTLFFIELLVSLKLEPSLLTPEIQMCNFPTLSYFYPFLYAELAETCVIPFAIMIVTSIVTIRLLVKSRKLLERIGNADKHRRIRDMKFAITSLTFNFVFVTFKIPFLISYLMYSRIHSNYFSQVAFLLFLFNCSSNFFIHFATNSIFRRELFAILRFNNRNLSATLRRCW